MNITTTPDTLNAVVISASDPPTVSLAEIGADEDAIVNDCARLIKGQLDFLGNRCFTLVANETGRKQGMRFNRLATRLVPEFGRVYGDALLVGPVADDGLITSLPVEDMMRAINHLLRPGTHADG